VSFNRGDKIVLATGNQGKVRELGALLQEFEVEVLPQNKFGVKEAEETGLTFVENAILKARNAAAHTGMPAIADDSGLEVDFIKGAPGIYSARYATLDGESGVSGDGEDEVGGDLANNKKVTSSIKCCSRAGAHCSLSVFDGLYGASRRSYSANSARNLGGAHFN